MKKQFLRLAVRLIVFCAVLSILSIVVAYADDNSYFAAFYAADSTFDDTLNNCRAEPGYPANPTESQCRFRAWDAYTTDLSTAGSPSYGVDFCSMARAARDHCILMYGPNGSTPDGDTFASCWYASQVHYCE